MNVASVSFDSRLDNWEFVSLLEISRARVHVRDKLETLLCSSHTSLESNNTPNIDDCRCHCRLIFTSTDKPSDNSSVLIKHDFNVRQIHGHKIIESIARLYSK